MPRITVRGPGGPGVEILLEERALHIGRAPTNDLVLDDPTLSWYHATIRPEGGGWVVEDRKSRNGTWLNGTSLGGPIRLRAGDVITLGATELSFDGESAAKGREETVPAVHLGPLSGGDSGGGREEPVLVGRSDAIATLLGGVDRTAAAAATVLITGESGTGKELVARLLHLRSPRAAGPFAVVNCPALPGTLLESELFGVEKGVATGVEPRPGLLESAQGGTLLLDEIGDMDPAAQAKLLRVLQEKSFERVGGRTSIPLDVRFLAATHHDLAQDVESGSFRRDLYHRLRVLALHLPPLRERREDIPLLAEHFLRRGGGDAPRLGDEAAEVLRGYAFPGNVRELEHAMEHALVHAEGSEVRPGDLPAEILHGAAAGGAPAPSGAVDALFDRVVHGGESFWDVVRAPLKRRELSKDEVRRLIARAHREAGGSYKAMARLFHMEEEYRALLNFLGKYEVGVPRRGRSRGDS